MPEYLRAYIVVFILSNFVFWLLPKLKISFIDRSEIKQWRNYWLIVTTLCFFITNIWLYVACLTILLGYVNHSKVDRLPLFFAISCASPLYFFTIPGFGVINYLITLSNISVLVVLVLWPEARSTKNRSVSNYPFYSAVIAYLIVISFLDARENTVTNSLRQFVKYYIVILLPFMALSKSVTNVDTFKKCFFALALCLTPLALIGCFESLKYWKLYSPAFANLLGEGSELRYGLRGDSLRASALFSSVIAFGYMMVIGMGVLLFLQKHTNQKNLIRFIFILFLGALYFTKARGPWLGLIVMIVLYIWSGPNRLGNFSKFTFGSALALLGLSLTSFGAKLISMLPFLSSSTSHEASTVDYRFKLLEQAISLFHKNPLFGLPNYRDTPEMEVMRQGQGIIDVVNSYIDIGLSYGIVGLGLFLFIFLGLFFTVLKKLRSLPAEQADLINIGRSLYAILGAILFIILTVSSVNYIPIFYWLIAGLCSAYIRLCNTVISDYKNQSNTQPHPTQAASLLSSPP
jgi:O-antigen ligase